MTQDSTWDIILNLNSGTFVIFPYLDTDKKLDVYLTSALENSIVNIETPIISLAFNKKKCDALVWKILIPESYNFSRKDQMNRHVASQGMH